MTKRAVWIAAMLVIVFSAASVIYHVLVPERAPFASVQWMMAAAEQDYGRRHAMLNDLRRLLESGAVQDREAARVLLGTPDRGEADDELWGYRLGGEDQWSRRYERWLELMFDGGGGFAGYRLFTDAAEAPAPERAVME
jgi:hypothetical protein